MSERLESIPELQAATNEFIEAIRRRAPESEASTVVNFEEDGRMRRSWSEARYTCSVQPRLDGGFPPTVVLTHGMSAICHERNAFRFDYSTGQYWKTTVDVEPRMETQSPDEYYSDPVPASSFELGKVIGIIDTLIKVTPTPVEQVPTDDIPDSRNWLSRLLLHERN